LPTYLTSDGLKDLIQSLPEVSAWKDIADVFGWTGGTTHPDWQLPNISCQAVGCRSTDAVAATTAFACLQISIMLADDMRNEDPRSEHERRGPGAAANLAHAQQSAAYGLIDKAPVSHAQKETANNSLARAALATAFGQRLDNQSLLRKKKCWAVVAAASTPLYGICYELGAIMAGSSTEVIDRLDKFGGIIGKIILIEDDLDDAFSRPANPDWVRQGNNLLIIYALVTDYKQPDEYLSLLPIVTNDETDASACTQGILIKNGAASYAAYHLVQWHQQAWRLLDQFSLPDPAPKTQILNDCGKTLSGMFTPRGVDIDLTSLRTEPVSGTLKEGSPVGDSPGEGSPGEGA
jgi:geranylgeranyl pyrophosphate synthase